MVALPTLSLQRAHRVFGLVVRRQGRVLYKAAAAPLAGHAAAVAGRINAAASEAAATLCSAAAEGRVAGEGEEIQTPLTITPAARPV